MQTTKEETQPVPEQAIVLLRLDSSGRNVTDLPGLWDESDSLYIPVDKKKIADKERCAAMGAAERREIHTHIMQALINCGMNAFAFDLMAESLLKSPAPQRLDIVFPVSRTDCDRWAGVRFVLEPIAVRE